MALLSQLKQVFLFTLLISASLAPGCKDSGVDPATASWENIAVDYCVGSPPQVVMKSWATEDQELISDLREAFRVTSKQPLSLVPTMTTNRVAITSSGGGNIVMHIYDEERLSFYNTEDRQQSYSITVDNGFVQKLRNIIQDATDETIHFYYDREVTISP